MALIATAGSRGEKIRSDCFVQLEIRKKMGITLSLKSRVEALFGNQIRNQALEVLAKLGIKHASVELEDTGALPFVIAARLEAAVKKLVKTDLEYLPALIPSNMYTSERDQIRFSRLYLPGNTPSMMLNAGIHRPNGIILDLEDSVAPDQKGEARYLVRNALRQVDFYGAERMVRINQLPAGLEDLAYVVPHAVNLILIPKCENGKQVIEVDARVKEILKERQSENQIFYIPIIESCLGVENAFEIATSSEQVVALAIGLEDYTADLGVKRTPSGSESFYARARVVNACKAAAIQPIDSVFSDVGDTEGLIKNVKESKALGFEGMGCIHPRQIRLVHEGFRPGEKEIIKAEKIIEAFQDAKSRGLGVIAMGTKMIDPPVFKRARRTMQLAYQFGLRKEVNN